jgi:predicted aspartyl protease
MARSSAARRRRAAWLLAAIALAPLPAAAACRLEPRAAVSLTENWNFLVFPATIGGEPVSMLLDSGADAGLVTAEAADRLRLPAGSARTVIEGTGASLPVPTLRLDTLAIGGAAMPAALVPVAPLPTEPRVHPPVAGLVGADLLAGFEVDIDVPAHRLALARAAGACDDFRPWPGAAPVAATRDGNRLVVEAVLDGHRLRALVETGARSTILDTTAAARIGLDAAALAKDPGGVTGGVDLRPVLYHWHRFRTLVIGGVSESGPVLTVSAVNAPADLLLGADFFARHRVWLSYAGDRIFIGPRSPASAPPAPAAAASGR